MSTPTDLPLDELRALQARAYGRDADIQSDPAALARLHELEARASAARTGSTVPTADAAPAQPAAPAAQEGLPETADRHQAVSGGDRVGTDAAAGVSGGITTRSSGEPAPGSDASAPVTGATTLPGAGTPGDVAEPAGTGSGSAAAEPVAGVDTPTSEVSAQTPARPWWRRIPVLWAASVVAALLIGAGVSAWIQNLEEGRVAVLREDSDAEWPDMFFGARPADGLVFDGFHGLTVLSFPQSVAQGSAQTCLYILTPPDGFGAGSCAAGSYPASASMEVVSSSPEALRDRFPLGTSLQFVLEDSTVQVYAREPSIVEQTP
ncbi:MAG TPA: hypothetical protein VIP82_05310 [Microbacterium sp.]|uniref:hypothetical protein n=1 Tax=Microbacterium sp. TaxID=51671 RepID=UPI002F93E825